MDTFFSECNGFGCCKLNAYLLLMCSEDKMLNAFQIPKCSALGSLQYIRWTNAKFIYAPVFYAKTHFLQI